MKQGTLVTRIVIVLLFMAVVVYMGVYLLQGLSDPYQLVVTYSYAMDDAISLDGVVVRSERTVEGRAQLAEVLPQEGERVAAGAAVAMIYQDEGALADRRRARSIEQELEQLNYAMRRGDTVADGKELDSQLIGDLAALRSQTSAGDLDDLEDYGLNIRSLVVKRTGQAETNAETLAQLQQTVQDLEGELTQLKNSSAQGIRRIVVDQAGVFSGLADGLESTLTPQMLGELSVNSLDQLREREIQPLENALGKLITDSTWYYAAAVPTADARRLVQGERYTLAFSGDFNQEISMTLERLGPEEDGRHVAVFSSDRYLNQITLCRFQSARLVFERFTGVRVPDKALRVLEKEDGTTSLGIFTLVGRQAEFKRVEVVREGEGFYLVRGTDTNRKVLRPGDTIILSNRELYEGKVVA